MAFYVDTIANRIVVASPTDDRPWHLKVIDGDTVAACHLTDGQVVSPQQAAALLDGSPGAYRATLTPEQLAAAEAARPAPAAAAPHAMSALKGVTYLGSHPRHTGTVESLTVAFGPSGFSMAAYDEPWQQLYWDQIRSVAAATQESVERRITATRVLLLGAIGLFAKKERIVSYLIVGDDDGEWMFAVSGVSAMALRAWTQPAEARVTRDRATILPPPPVGASTGSMLSSADEIEARLARIDTLRDRGVITADEHATQRAAIVAGL